jgi:hypothetical protein
MSLFPDREADQRKEEVLQRAPFLETLLNSNYEKLNPEAWATDLITKGNLLIEDMTARLGNDWYRLTIMPLLISGEVQEVLHPRMPRALKFAVVKGIVMAGFEVGDQEDVDSLLVDVVKKLGEDQVLHPQCLDGGAGSFKAVDYISTLLETGAYLRQVPQLDNSGNQPKQPVNPFDDFINGLDFKGL